MANYSVDDEIASFFNKTTTTREACDAFAAGLGGCSTPVDIQGVCSYTVYAGPQSELVVQFRLKSLKLSLEISHTARLIYGDFVPRVEYRGQLGEDMAATDCQDSRTEGAREALLIYVMDRVPGITHLDFVLAHNAEVPEASPEFAQWRMNLTKGVAKFFALSWKSPQKLDEAKKDDMQKRQKGELELLQRSLPKRFEPIVQRSLEALPDIFSTLPTVLSHSDFGACNVLVDSASCELTGVVDWAEAKIAPFGLNLHSYQRFLGAVHLRTGWSRYEDYAATEEAFWDTFCKESGEHDPRVIKTIKAARVVGLLLSLGLTSRLANQKEATPIQDDEAGAYSIRDLDGLRPPTPAQSVYREDCTQCFDSIDDADGLDVCLQCFNGGCAGDRHHAKLHNLLWSHPLALNIRRTRRIVVRDEPPPKISKLAIAAETEEDRYDTTLAVKCLECDTELDKADAKLAPIVDGILKANTFSRKEEVKAWEQELTSCEHVLTLNQEAQRKIASQDLGHCSKCELNENLWLCLQCGNLGCGRAQFGGVGGNSHGLAHATESGHGVAVKLGSITPEGSADVYCYTCDDERIDDKLGDHLAHWGIILAERQKTEKSLTEMQIEQNMRWEFSMTTEDGQELRPLFGPGLTGLKNLGNSCYLASILQCLYDLPAFQKRYKVVSQDLPGIRDPADDLETQLRKVGDGLLSGRYSKPDSDVSVSEHSPEVPHQKGLAPAMLKHLVGRGHEEFSTMRQQDAFELLQHLIKLVTRSKHPTPADDPTAQFRFVLEQRLQCLSCKKVRYTTNEQDSIFIDVPLEKLPVAEEKGADGGDGDGSDKKAGGEAYKPVTFKECLDRFTGEETVELTCASCGSKDGYTKRSLFKTLPAVFVVNARKMTLINWVPVKVDVPVLVDDTPFLMDEYVSQGQQPGEELLPEDSAAAAGGGGAPSFVANPEAVAQLETMGFPLVRCEKALHATGNSDANAAMEWLFGHMDDPDIDEPLVLASSGGGSGGDAAAGSASPEKIEMLGAMGFGEPQAKQALRETGGDVERAVEWLFSHPDATGDDGGSADAAGGDASAEQPPAGTSDTPAKYQLQSIVCHKGTSIHAGHYVAFIRKKLSEDSDKVSWVLFNDEKVVEVVDVEEMKKFAYIYFFKRV